MPAMLTFGCSITYGNDDAAPSAFDDGGTEWSDDDEECINITFGDSSDPNARETLAEMPPPAVVAAAPPLERAASANACNAESIAVPGPLEADQEEPSAQEPAAAAFTGREAALSLLRAAAIAAPQQLSASLPLAAPRSSIVAFSLPPSQPINTPPSTASYRRGRFTITEYPSDEAAAAAACSSGSSGSEGSSPDGCRRMSYLPVKQPTAWATVCPINNENSDVCFYRPCVSFPTASQRSGGCGGGSSEDGGSSESGSWCEWDSAEMEDEYFS